METIQQHLKKNPRYPHWLISFIVISGCFGLASCRCHKMIEHLQLEIEYDGDIDNQDVHNLHYEHPLIVSLDNFFQSSLFAFHYSLKNTNFIETKTMTHIQILLSGTSPPILRILI